MSKQLSCWTIDRNIIHSISENFPFAFVSSIGMLEKVVSKSTNIKELSLCSSYNDTTFFKPPLKFADLPAHDRQTVIWLTSKLVLIGTKVIYLIVIWK